MQMLSQCEKSTNSLKYTTVIQELVDFNHEARIFENYDIIKKLINMNSACAKNMETEGAKILKDFSAYLQQLIRFLEKA